MFSESRIQPRETKFMLKTETGTPKGWSL